MYDCVRPNCEKSLASVPSPPMPGAAPMSCGEREHALSNEQQPTVAGERVQHASSAHFWATVISKEPPLASSKRCHTQPGKRHYPPQQPSWPSDTPIDSAGKSGADGRQRLLGIDIASAGHPSALMRKPPGERGMEPDFQQQEETREPTLARRS